MIKRRVAILMLALACSTLLVGCNNLSREKLDSIATINPSIGYLDEKFRICRENCPKRTRKVLDDADYEAIQTPPASIPQSEPPMTQIQPGSNEKSANEHADSFIVNFEFGKSIPSGDGFKTLAMLIIAAKQTDGSIDLFGETDDIGTQHYNDTLASSRVHFVARWLRSHGVKARISVEAKGGCCHLAPYDKTDAALQEKRRVLAKVQQPIEKGGSPGQ